MDAACAAFEGSLGSARAGAPATQLLQMLQLLQLMASGGSRGLRPLKKLPAAPSELGAPARAMSRPREMALPSANWQLEAELSDTLELPAQADPPHCISHQAQASTGTDGVAGAAHEPMSSGTRDGESAPSGAHTVAIETHMDKILAKLEGLEFRMDRSTGMYDAAALVSSANKKLDYFRRARSDGKYTTKQARQDLIESVMRNEGLPRERVWVTGRGGRPTMVCGTIACAIAVWLRPELEASVLCLVSRLAEARAVHVGGDTQVPGGGSEDGVGDVPGQGQPETADPDAAPAKESSIAIVCPTRPDFRCGPTVPAVEELVTKTGMILRLRRRRDLNNGVLEPIEGLRDIVVPANIAGRPGCYVGVKGKVVDESGVERWWVKLGLDNKDVESRPQEHAAQYPHWCTMWVGCITGADFLPDRLEDKLKAAFRRSLDVLVVESHKCEEFLIPARIAEGTIHSITCEVERTLSSRVYGVHAASRAIEPDIPEPAVKTRPLDDAFSPDRRKSASVGHGELMLSLQIERERTARLLAFERLSDKGWTFEQIATVLGS